MKGVRWCNISPDEATKCFALQRNLKKVDGPTISCVKKTSTMDCIIAIAVSQRHMLGKTKLMEGEARVEKGRKKKGKAGKGWGGEGIK